jgi:hypothetical protein
LGIAEGKINDPRLYRCLDRVLPHQTQREQHRKQRYGELFEGEFDVLLYDLTSTYVEGAAAKNPRMCRGYSRDHGPDCEGDGDGAHRQPRRISLQLGDHGRQWRGGVDQGNDPAHGGA